MKYKLFNRIKDNVLLFKILLVCIGTILLVFGFFVYIGYGDFTLLFVALGLLFIPFLFWIIDYQKSLSLNHKKKLRIKMLKANGNRVVVNLEKVRIKTSSWTENRVINTGRIGGLYQFMGREEANIEKVNICLNNVWLKVPYKGKSINFEITVAMDPENLKLHFLSQKETILYVDPQNPSNYHLDLQFLYK